MRISFHTLGCKQNYAETSHISEQFTQAGHNIVEFGEPCDAVLINTCTVTENADTECRKIIRRALRVSPNAFIGVTGCYAQLQPEEIASVEGVDAVFGAKEKFNIPYLISDFSKFNTPKIFADDTTNLEFVEAAFSEHDSRHRAYLKLQDGCDYNCSFCTIPLARGASRSMNFNEIEKHVRRLEDSGYKEVVLTGINLGEYKSSGGERFADVLRCIADLQPTFRVRISSIEPNKVTNEVLEIVASSDTFCKHFHIPLQSGSPEILRAMRRRYTAEYYADLVYRIKSSIPYCAIGVDVITGFPGEDDRHFEESHTFLSELPISYLHVFTYSERENTPASSYESKVPIRVRKDRTRRLRELSASKKSEFYNSEINSLRTVIPERFDQLTGLWSGYSENYVRVQFKQTDGVIPKSVRVVITDANDDVMNADVIEVIEFSSEEKYIPIVI